MPTDGLLSRLHPSVSSTYLIVNRTMSRINLHKLFSGSGYLIVDCAHDTTNIICARGTIYAEGMDLVASLDNGTPVECRMLRKHGTVVADGDFGELSVRFEYTPQRFREVARIMRPKQGRRSKAAA
jgi:hypothetical protein